MTSRLIHILLFLYLITCPLHAGETEYVSVSDSAEVMHAAITDINGVDSLHTKPILFTAEDSIALKNALKEEAKQRRRDAIFKRIPDPGMAAWIAALFPGAGQIYNRQYWKVPIVYAGFAGLSYAITWNNGMYVDYRKGYTDLCGSDPTAKYYEYLLPEGVTINASNIDYYKRTFKSKMEGYQRNRDLSIMATAILYLLSIIDAYVDAQLRDYDVSPDLSMSITPTVIPPTQDKALESSVGVSCKLKF